MGSWGAYDVCVDVVCVAPWLCACLQRVTDSMLLPVLPLVKVLLRVGLLSVDEVARRLANGSTAAIPIPASGAACPGGSLLATSSWVGYNSSPDGDRALSQRSSTGLPLACSVLGKRFSGVLVCEL